MHPDLQQIQEAAEGLLYLSESDYPFEIFQLRRTISPIEDELKKIAGMSPKAPVEKTTLTYFFRNAVKIYPEATSQQKDTAQRFLQLQNLLEEKMSGVEVYRIGTIRIDAFIIGKLADGTYGGLRTKVIET